MEKFISEADYILYLQVQGFIYITPNNTTTYNKTFVYLKVGGKHKTPYS
jgi:hypothetical protein